jgi:hypothetical protein
MDDESGSVTGDVNEDGGELTFSDTEGDVASTLTSVVNESPQGTGNRH